MSTPLDQRIAEVEKRISRACKKAGRDASEVTLLPASKKQSVETLRQVLDYGIDTFGENRVQEAKPKISMLPASVHWEFIGGLQRNKVKDVVGYFDLIHSVDSLKLAEEIEKRASSRGLVQKVLIEINIGGEAAKHGVPPEEAFITLEAINALAHVEVHGLMTVAPFREDLEAVRPYFRQLRELRDDLESRLGFGLPVLSMGMTHDFEIAIEEGATVVRIGTAIFGARQ